MADEHEILYLGGGVPVVRRRALTAAEIARRQQDADDERAAEQAEAAEVSQDNQIREYLAQTITALTADRDLLADSTQVLTLALLRPILLRLVRVNLATLRLLRRKGV